MRRLLVDLIGLSLLIAPIRLHLLPSNSGLPILLSIPVLVGFTRGFAEAHFLSKIPHTVAALEWAVIVFASDIILCIPNSKSDPHTNFLTVFGAFFLIFIVPSIALSIGGFIVAVIWQTGRRDA
jgi:hypothetical protein